RGGCGGEEGAGCGQRRERVPSPVLEREPTAHDETTDRFRHEDVVGFREAVHSRGDVDSESADVRVAQLDLAGVDPRTNRHAELAQLFSQRNAAPECALGAVEGGEDAVTSGPDDLAAMLFNSGSGDVVVAIDQTSPFCVAEPHG